MLARLGILFVAGVVPWVVIGVDVEAALARDMVERRIIINGEAVRARQLMFAAPKALEEGTEIVESGGLFGSSKKYKVGKLLGSGNFGNVYLTDQPGMTIKQTIEKYPKYYEGKPHPLAGHNPLENEDAISDIFASAHPDELKHVAMTKKSFVAPVAIWGTSFRFQISPFAGDKDLSKWNAEHEDPDKAPGFSGTGWLADVKRVVLDASEGLARLKGREVLHGDVKPANIMVTIKGGRVTKASLIDFGIAQHIPHSLTFFMKGFQGPEDAKLIWPPSVFEPMHKRCPQGWAEYGAGSKAFMPPEVLGVSTPRNRRFTCAPPGSSDMWSLGVSIFEMLVSPCKPAFKKSFESYAWFDSISPIRDVSKALAKLKEESRIASRAVDRNPHLKSCGLFSNENTSKEAHHLLGLLDEMLNWYPGKRIRPEQVVNFFSSSSSYVPVQDPEKGSCDRSFAAAAMDSGLDPGKTGKRQCEICLTKAKGRKAGQHCKYCSDAAEGSRHCFSNKFRFALSSRWCVEDLPSRCTMLAAQRLPERRLNPSPEP